jgi:hypothetical protein
VAASGWRLCGRIDGIANTTAMLELKAGSKIDLGVDAMSSGAYNGSRVERIPRSVPGTLHLRAPRAGKRHTNSTLSGDILGASSVLAEGFRVYDRTGQTTLDTGFTGDHSRGTRRLT